MDHGVWHQARDAGGRLYFFNDAGETRWDWPGGEAAPLAVQNAFAGALQQPVVAGGNAPISRELAERCLGEMRQDKSTIARLEGQLAVAAADRAAVADSAVSLLGARRQDVRMVFSEITPDIVANGGVLASEDASRAGVVANLSG